MIFDFFGTLTVSVPARERMDGHAEVAAALGVAADDYARVLLESWPERARSRLGDLETTMRRIARSCGVEVDDSACAAACEVRRTTQRDYLRLRPEAEPTLRGLRAGGVRVGLVSDCTHELPEAWLELPIAAYVEAPVFSVEVGMKKPDPSIFLLVCERLEVEPRDCVYVGDGDSNELSGATAVGMTAKRLLTPDHADAHVIDPITWTGATISNLGEVLLG